MVSIDRKFRQFQRTGDPNAFASVFDATAPGLLRVASILARNSHAAEDLVQTTYLTAIEKSDTWRREAGVQHWLMGILTRLARNQRRRNHRRPDATRLWSTTPAEPPEQAEATELDRALREHIASLPEVYQPVLIAHLERGSSAQEIARSLGRPSGTVRTQIVRGMDLLRRSLPAGLAGSLVVSATAAQGLAIVRREVMRVARLAAPAAGSVAASTGRRIRFLNAAVVAAVALVVTVLSLVARELFSVGPAPPASERQAAVASPGEKDEVSGAANEVPSPPRTVVAPVGSASQVMIDVVWENDGQPAAATAVSVLPLDGRNEHANMVWYATDAAGHVALELPAGRHRIAADLGETVDVELCPGERHAFALRAQPGFEVLGEVVDLAGAPVGGAEIWVHHEHRNQDGAPARGHPVTISDAAGRFRFEHLREYRWIDARDSGVAPSKAYLLESGSESPPLLTLELGGPAAELCGRIIADGQPVPGTLLELTWSDPVRTPGLGRHPVFFWQQRTGRSVRTDAEGRFEFLDLPAGIATLVARGPHHAPCEVLVELVPGAAAVQDIQIEPGCTLRGTVCDPDGEPLADAVVSTSVGGVDHRARSTAAGTFEFTDLPPATVAILVSRDGYCGARVGRVVAASAVEECAIVLVPLRWLRGRVVDPSGEGVASYQVVARRVGAGVVETDATGRVDQGARTDRGSTTDQDGRFEIAVLPGHEYVLAVQSRSLPTLIEDDTWSGLVAPLDGIELRLGPEHLATAYVELQPLTDTGAPLTDVTFRPIDPLPTESLPGGRVRIGPLAPGRHSIQVEWACTPALRFTLPSFDLHPHQVLDLGKCVAPAPGAMAHLVVRACYADGQPPATAWLNLGPPTGDGRGSSSTQSIVRILDEAGRAEFFCEPGRYGLCVAGGGFRAKPWIVELTRGDRRQCDFVLEPAVTRLLVCPLPPGETRGELRVLDPRGDDVPLDYPTLLPDTGERVFRHTASRPTNCSWTLWLGPGQHRVELICASGNRWTSEFYVPDLIPDAPPITLVWSASH